MALAAPRSRTRRTFLWLHGLTAASVAVGVVAQAFTIAAFVRGAGADARDLHVDIGFATHSVEIVVLLLAIPAYWRAWREVLLALSLPVVGTIQVLAIGDTEEVGGWINGLHGAFALVVLLLALGLAWRALRIVGRRPALDGPGLVRS